MPSWQPNWNDVDYDFVGAEEALALARQCRQVLEDRDAVIGVPLEAARRQWRGRKRDVFDEAEAAIERRAMVLHEELLGAEARVRQEMEEARLEQAHRIAERARWAEAIAEQRAAEAAAAEAAAANATCVAATTTTEKEKSWSDTWLEYIG